MLREEMYRHIDEMKDKGVISEAATEWSAPVISVSNKSTDETKRYRFVADFRGLNNVTQAPSFPMPLVHENIDRLNGNQYFTIVDIEDAYYHIPIHERDRHKAGINTPFSTYQYNRLAFGLAGAPYTFTKVINNVLLGLGETTCLNFMDDTLIFSRTIEEHAKRLQKVFERLRRASFTVNVAKCNFAQDQVEYLGHTVGKQVRNPVRARSRPYDRILDREILEKSEHS
jgi:hypothetical protein